MPNLDRGHSIGKDYPGVEMDIAVLIKYVPDSTAKITVSGDRVNESAVSKWSISPFDEYALEAALSMKESAGASVTAITCGPSRSEKGLRDAAAVGADALVHVAVDDLTSLDSTKMQALLAAAVQNNVQRGRRRLILASAAGLLVFLFCLLEPRPAFSRGKFSRSERGSSGRA